MQIIAKAKILISFGLHLTNKTLFLLLKMTSLSFAKIATAMQNVFDSTFFSCTDRTNLSLLWCAINRKDTELQRIQYL